LEFFVFNLGEDRMQVLLQRNVLLVLQIITGVLSIVLILMQAREAGLSSTFGGSGFYGNRRGVEKVVFNTTIIMITLFMASCLLMLFA
jgi:protein translocase SecG subunit